MACVILQKFPTRSVCSENTHAYVCVCIANVIVNSARIVKNTRVMA